MCYHRALTKRNWHNENGLTSRFLREYWAYKDAQRRCSNPTRKSWRYYGGRGIQFRLQSFRQLIDEVGPKPTTQHRLDRIDTNGHYEVGNLRWATMKESRENQRPRGRDNIDEQNYELLVAYANAVIIKGKPLCVTSL